MSRAEELRCFFCGKLFRTIGRLALHEEACGESQFEDGPDEEDRVEAEEPYS